jgi:hypothetical protein
VNRILAACPSWTLSLQQETVVFKPDSRHFPGGSMIVVGGLTGFGLRQQNPFTPLSGISGNA